MTMARAHLSTLDALVVGEWKKPSLGILRSIPEKKFAHIRHRGLIYCADMRRAMEIVGHLRELMVKHAGGNPYDVRCSPWSIFGGPLNLDRTLATTCSCTHAGEDVNYAAYCDDQIEKAIQLFQMDLLMICPHIPCAVAGMNKLSAPEMMRRVIDGVAETRVKYLAIREIEYYVHVDNGRQNTYEFDPDCFEDWYQELWPAWREQMNASIECGYFVDYGSRQPADAAIPIPVFA